MDAPQAGEAVLGQERGLGLVEQGKAVGIKTIDHHGEKGLAMRLLVQRHSPVGAKRGWTQPLQVRCGVNRLSALRKKSVAGRYTTRTSRIRIGRLHRRASAGASQTTC